MTPERAVHWWLEAGKHRTGSAEELQTTNFALLARFNHDAHPSQTETTHMDRLVFQQIFIP